MTAGPPIDDLLEGRWRDPATGKAPRLPIGRIEIAPSLDGAEADLLAPLRLGARLAVVSDPRTREAMGRRVERALGEIARIESVVLAEPRADLITGEDLADRTRHADALVAVGSGTLNDLAKHAAHASGRAYVVFGTAPSMNGYVTATASLEVDGLKSTLPARAPRAVLLDLEVLARAPARLIRAGLGDALCRTTAQVDWLLAHLLRGTPYREAPFLLQAEDEAPMLAGAGATARGDPEAVLRLVRMLLLSGLGMVIAGSSAPASQGEHLLSHDLDMLAEPHPGSLHGEQVGVATLTMSRLQHRMLDAGTPPEVRPTVVDENAIGRHFGPRLAEPCLGELRAKALDGAAADALNRRLAARWGAITAGLRPLMLATARLERALSDAGAPTTAAALGFDPAVYRDAVRFARAIRDRYTALDLAADAGLLDAFAAGEG